MATVTLQQSPQITPPGYTVLDFSGLASLPTGSNAFSAVFNWQNFPESIMVVVPATGLTVSPVGFGELFLEGSLDSVSFPPPGVDVSLVRVEMPLSNTPYPIVTTVAKSLLGTNPPFARLRFANQSGGTLANPPQGTPSAFYVLTSWQGPGTASTGGTTSSGFGNAPNIVATINMLSFPWFTFGGATVSNTLTGTMDGHPVFQLNSATSGARCGLTMVGSYSQGTTYTVQAEIQAVGPGVGFSWNWFDGVSGTNDIFSPTIRAGSGVSETVFTFTPTSELDGSSSISFVINNRSGHETGSILIDKTMLSVSNAQQVYIDPVGQVPPPPSSAPNLVPTVDMTDATKWSLFGGVTIATRGSSADGHPYFALTAHSPAIRNGIILAMPFSNGQQYTAQVIAWTSQASGAPILFNWWDGGGTSSVNIPSQLFTPTATPTTFAYTFTATSQQTGNESIALIYNNSGAAVTTGTDIFEKFMVSKSTGSQPYVDPIGTPPPPPPGAANVIPTIQMAAGAPYNLFGGATLIASGLTADAHPIFAMTVPVARAGIFCVMQFSAGQQYTAQIEATTSGHSYPVQFNWWDGGGTSAVNVPSQLITLVSGTQTIGYMFFASGTQNATNVSMGIVVNNSGTPVSSGTVLFDKFMVSKSGSIQPYVDPVAVTAGSGNLQPGQVFYSIGAYNDGSGSNLATLLGRNLDAQTDYATHSVCNDPDGFFSSRHPSLTDPFHWSMFTRDNNGNTANSCMPMGQDNTAYYNSAALNTANFQSFIAYTRINVESNSGFGSFLPWQFGNNGVDGNYANNQAQFILDCQRLCAAVHNSTKLLTFWSINQASTNFDSYYPGDNAMDGIDLDFYDNGGVLTTGNAVAHFQSVMTYANWNKMDAFARSGYTSGTLASARNKQLWLGFSEYGVGQVSGDAVGAAIITGFAAFINDPSRASFITHHGYWNSASANSGYKGALSLYPQSAAAYKAAFQNTSYGGTALNSRGNNFTFGQYNSNS